MKAPRRLCVVNPYQHGGGAEFQIHRILELLFATGRFDVSYLAHHGRPEATDRYRLVKVGRDARPPRFGYLMDALPLYRALRTISPDVIYQRVACGYTAICAYYARRHRVPLIWHVAHDSDVMPHALSEGRNPLRPFLEKRSVEYGLRRADYIVVQKHEQRQLLEQHYGRTADLVVANFHPEPREEADKSGQTRVLWIANLKRWKQPEAFIRLAAALKDLPDVKFTMLGAPPGADADREWVDSLLAAVNDSPNLEYLGPKTHEEVNALLARAHLFVNTSLHEGFPNTFIQAWLRRVPVLSLHVDPDEVLSREGVGFKASSESELARLARKLLTDSATRSAMGERAHTYARQYHSAANAAPLLQLLQTGVARASAAGADV